MSELPADAKLATITTDEKAAMIGILAEIETLNTKKADILDARTKAIESADSSCNAAREAAHVAYNTDVAAIDARLCELNTRTGSYCEFVKVVPAK